MGWTLNAGGVVTRTSKGWPDEIELAFSCEGSCGVYGYFKEETQGYIHGISGYGDANNIYDLEPDLYFYNFGGKSGKMFFQSLELNSSPHISNLDPIKVKGPWDGTNAFQIVTEDGLIYRFSSTEITSFSSSYLPGTWGGYSYYSSWFLTEIEDPMTGQKITFEYRSNMPSLLYGWKDGASLSGRNCELNGAFNNSHITINSSKVLSRIVFDGGYVDFKADEQRQDFTGDLAYTEINLYTKENQLQKGFSLGYGYSSNGTGAEGKRLFLESVQDKGNSGTALPPYRFSYKSRDLLPPRNSPEHDIWGYFNDNNETTERSPKVYYMGGGIDYLPYKLPHATPLQVIDGMDMSCNLQTVDYGSLSRVVYPTGGYTDYTFEPHEFWNGYIGGGIRVKEIKDYDATGEKLLSKSYAYTSGFLAGGHPQVAFPSTSSSTGVIRFRQSLSALGSNAGSNVGYGFVTEYNGGTGGGNGYTQYQYLTERDRKTQLTFLADCVSGATSTTYFPFFEWESYEARRGLLDNVRYFDQAKERDPVKVVDYEYELKSGDAFTVKMEFSTAGSTGGKSYLAKGERTVRAEKMVMSSKSETVFDAEGNGFTTRTDFTYNDHLFVSSRFEYGNDGNITQYKYRYPTDFGATASGGVMGKMAAAHYISPVIEETAWKFPESNGSNTAVQVGGRVNNYAEFPFTPSALMIFPSQVFTLNAEAPLYNPTTVTDPAAPGSSYEERVAFLDYDLNGNPELISHDGQFERLSWKTYPHTRLLSRERIARADSYGLLYPPQGWTEIIGSDAKTGDSYFGNFDGFGSSFPSLLLDGLKTYHVSFWAKGGNVLLSTQAEDVGSVAAPAEWTYYSFLIPPKATLDGEALHMSGSAKVDEVRVSEGQALIETYYYDSLGRLRSACDEKGLITHYEYDAFGRLLNVRDGKKDIVKAYDYRFGPQPAQ